MPISTSGLSVPQVANVVDPSIYSNQASKGMTLGDMLDISKKQLELSKAQETYASDVAGLKAQSQSLQYKANQDALANIKSHVSNITQATSQLMADPDLTPEKILQAYKAINALAPGDELSKTKALQQTLAGMPQQQPGETADQFQTRLHQFIAVNQLKGLEHLSAVQQMYPATQQLNVGGQTVTQATGNPLTAAQQPGTPTGPYMQNTLAPTVAQGPTGGPMAFGGGGVPQPGNLNNRPVQVQTAVPAAGQNIPAQNAPQPTPKTGVTPEQMGKKKEASGPIPYLPGETYDAYRTRSGKVQESIGTAKNDIDVSNPNSVTNAKYTNEQILKALDDKNVRVGPLMQAIAEKSEGLNLTPDEQYVKKLLEQRIQQQQSRSNADQTSKTIASGNFGNSKDTIRSVLFKDMGNLTAQELQSRGTLNRAGNPNKPNLAGVNQFQNEFAKSADPDVTHLMGIIGSKPLNKLTPAEINHLQKEFAGKSKEEIDSLMKKRQAIIDLVGK